jgi:TatD DNase family protein
LHLFVDIHSHHSTVESNVARIENIFAHQISKKTGSQNLFSVGLHPWHIGNHDIDQVISQMVPFVSSANVIAIGECGLDKTIDTPLDLQKKIFEIQIKLSEELKKAMIIHCVGAYSEILQMRKKYKASMPWILHGYNSSVHMATQLLRRNCMLSFGKNVFNRGSKGYKVLAAIPAQSFFLETDDHQYSIEDIYNKAALLRGLSLEELKLQMLYNFNKIFPGLR